MNKKLDIDYFLEHQLFTIQKPGRYVGGEFNAVKKIWTTGIIKVALAFPDLYDIGFSNLGLAILYDEINKRPDALAERVYAPWLDMESLLRANQLPLFSLENRRYIKDFDILGFSIPYETLYTNVLNMLDLSEVPVRSDMRRDCDPIVIAGGHACFNPEPMHAFIDAFVIGEGEEIIHEIIEKVKADREEKFKRQDIINHLSEIDGIYVPAHFRAEFDAKKKITKIINFYQSEKKCISKRFVTNLPKPTVDFLVPNIKTVQERVAVEIMRGCSRGCRFCQAGIITRPVRERKPEVIIQSIKDAVRKTGFDEVSLLSLSTSDYSQIKSLLNEVSKLSKELSFEFSLPSLRIETFDENLMNAMKGKRKGNFTIAPEAASEQIRKSINKPISDSDLFRTVENIFQMGWRNLKLYFMIGFPDETNDDVERIADLCLEINAVNRKILKGKGKIHISINTLIPKAHTALQWSKMENREKVTEKYQILIKKLKKTGIKIDWPNYDMTLIEALLSRGDRRLSDVIESAWKYGAKFDSWHEAFDFNHWQESFMEKSISLDDYIFRDYDENEVLPWEHISSGVNKKFLYEEYLRSRRQLLTSDCINKCSGCGIQSIYGVACDVIRVPA